MKNLWAAIIIGIFTVAIFFPIFFQQKLFFNSDVLTYDYPLLSFYTTEFMGGKSFAWNPFYMSGFPSVISPIGYFFDALTRALVSILKDAFLAYHFRVFIYAFLTIFFSYLFGQAAGLSAAASLILGLGYFTGHTLNEFTAGLTTGGSHFMLPAFFWILLKIRSGKSFLRYSILGGLLLGVSWLSSFIQIVFYGVVLAFCYAIYLDVSHAKTAKKNGLKEAAPNIQNTPFRKILNYIIEYRAIAAFLLIGIISAIVALPGLLDTMLFKSLTLRQAGFGLKDLNLLHWSEILNVFFPYYVRVPFISTDSAGLYTGALPVLLGIITIFYFFRDKKIRFFIVAYLVILALLIKPTGLAWIMQHLPVFSSFHEIKRWLHPGAFLFAYLGAYGLDHLAFFRPEELRQKLKWFFRIGTTALILFTIGIVALNVFFIYAPWQNLSWQENTLNRILEITHREIKLNQFPMSHYVGVFNRSLVLLKDSFSLADWRFNAPLLFLFMGLGIIWALGKEYMNRKQFNAAVFSLTALAFFLTHAAEFHNFIPLVDFREEPAAYRALKDREINPYRYRILTFLTGESSFRNVRGKNVFSMRDDFILNREILSGDLNMFWRIPSASGYEPFLTQRQWHLWREIVANEDLRVRSGFSEKSDVFLEKQNEFISFIPLLSSYNVKYILSGYMLRDARLLEIPLHTEKFSDMPLFLYENLVVLPRIFVPLNIQIAQEWDDAYFDKINNNAVMAVIECSSCLPESRMQKNGQVYIEDYTNGFVRFVADIPEESWIVISESFLPGWTATIDSKPVEIYSTNYLMQAILVPIGKHEIILEYKKSGGMTTEEKFKKLFLK